MIHCLDFACASWFVFGCYPRPAMRASIFTHERSWFARLSSAHTTVELKKTESVPSISTLVGSAEPADPHGGGPGQLEGGRPKLLQFRENCQRLRPIFNKPLRFQDSPYKLQTFLLLALHLKSLNWESWSLFLLFFEPRQKKDAVPCFFPGRPWAWWNGASPCRMASLCTMPFSPGVWWELQHKESKHFNDATSNLCYGLKKRFDTVETQAA